MNGKVVLTDEGIPGEVLEVRPVSEKRNYVESEIVRIITPSPDRIKPVCAHYKICSQYQYINYSLQVKIKEAQIREIFSHNFGLQLEHDFFRPSLQNSGYRNKIQFNVIKNNGSYSPAYHNAKQRNSFTPVDNCALAPEISNKVITDCINGINEYKIDWVKELMVKTSQEHSHVMLFIKGAIPFGPSNLNKVVSDLIKAHGLKSVVYRYSEAQRLTTLYGIDYLNENICGYDFYIGAESFFQVNIPALKLLAEDIKNHALPNVNNGHLADLYSGIGTFGIILSKYFKKVTCMESLKENISFLKTNATANSVKHMDIISGDCGDSMPALQPSPDLALIDPPRNGLSKNALAGIAALKPPAIVYISCDPATLTRDIKFLSGTYDISKVFAYDFFPQTPHIETMVILRQK